MQPLLCEDGITIYHGDCRDVLPSIQCARLIVTDPPYVFGIASTLHDNKKNGGWGDLMNAAVWYEGWFGSEKTFSGELSGCRMGVQFVAILPRSCSCRLWDIVADSILAGLG